MRTAKNMSCSKIIRRRRRDQKWLHTATRKNHISNRMRRIIIHTGIFTYESAGQWNVPGNQRR